ncbi:MAG: DUF192 domain-containing protein [Candidatus Avelusimicrobium sp.]|uniref:DUF192 domain-containing protein n=1 Tax=Candidatus Avelusimicrobium sp. TaxID=3048833 RepID=UPI003F043541
MKKECVRIVTDLKTVFYEVEIPTTEKEYADGLGFRDSLAEGTGMVYDYHANPWEAPMYTPDTRFPVDFIFVDSKGFILKISTAEPLSEEIHQSANTAMVLEINGGEAKKAGIKEGDIVCCSVIGSERYFSDYVPSGLYDYKRYGCQVFAKNESAAWMYSFGVHSWVNITESSPSAFELKLTNYERQNITPVPMTKDEADVHINLCEKKFKESFRLTKSEFFVWNGEFVLKYDHSAGKVFMYVYGKGWEEIEWWEDKNELMRGIYLSCLKCTSSEAERVISNIEKECKNVAEINNRNEDFINKPDFMGKHFESLGNVWEAVGRYNDVDAYLYKLSEEMLYPVPENAPMDEKERSFLRYMQRVYGQFDLVMGISPNLQDDFKMLFLAEKKAACLEFVSCYPLMKGCKNEVTITGFHRWSNGCQGVFAADFNGLTSINWFEPFFLHGKRVLKPNTKKDIYFSGLALSLKKSESNIITVDKGGFYEVCLKDFLEKNPNKTAKDMPPVRVEVGKAQCFLPTEYVPEYEYQTEVLEVADFTADGKKIYKMKISVLQESETDTALQMNLYAFEDILHGYIPKKGDFIRGVLWMQGYSVAD